MKKCKYENKNINKGYITCGRDNSTRKRPCHCPFFDNTTLWDRVKKWFSERFYW